MLTSIGMEVGSSQIIRILVADDELESRKLFKILLERQKSFRCVVDVAASCREAEAEILKERHDIYLLDEFMGDGVATDMVKRLHGHGQLFPFIIMSGVFTNSVRRMANEAGAAGSYPKTDLTNPIFLRAAILSAINRYVQIPA